MGHGCAPLQSLLDYSYQPFGDLGAAQRVSFSYLFEADEAGAPAPEATTANKWLSGARAFERQGKLGLALKSYHQAVDADDQDAEAWKGMGKAYLKAGRKDYASQCLRKAMKLRPEDKEIRRLMESVSQR